MINLDEVKKRFSNEYKWLRNITDLSDIERIPPKLEKTLLGASLLKPIWNNLKVVKTGSFGISILQVKGLETKFKFSEVKKDLELQRFYEAWQLNFGDNFLTEKYYEEFSLIDMYQESVEHCKIKGLEMMKCVSNGKVITVPINSEKEEPEVRIDGVMLGRLNGFMASYLGFVEGSERTYDDLCVHPIIIPIDWSKVTPYK